MQKQSNVSGGGGIGFIGLLTLIFITLKLVGVVNWPWVWVLSPMWIMLLVVAALFTIILCIGKIYGNE